MGAISSPQNHRKHSITGLRESKTLKKIGSLPLIKYLQEDKDN